jgi:hypothetical protein
MNARKIFVKGRVLTLKADATMPAYCFQVNKNKITFITYMQKQQQ